MARADNLISVGIDVHAESHGKIRGLAMAQVEKHCPALEHGAIFEKDRLQNAVLALEASNLLLTNFDPAVSEFITIFATYLFRPIRYER